MHFMEANRRVAERFKYAKDSDQYNFKEVWRVIDTDNPVWEGDCEDYALTVLWLISDRSIIKFLFNILINPKFSIWHVTTERGVGHAILKYEDMYVDNIQRKWFAKTDKPYKTYEWLFPIIPPLIFGKFLISAPFLLWGLINQNYRK